MAPFHAALVEKEKKNAFSLKSLISEDLREVSIYELLFFGSECNMIIIKKNLPILFPFSDFIIFYLLKSKHCPSCS